MPESELEEHRRWISKGVVRLQLGSYVGTAFMVAEDLALTALHNAERRRSKPVDATYFDGETNTSHPLTFRWEFLEGATPDDDDVALLRLVTRPANCPLRTLRVGMLPVALSYDEATTFWAGRRAAVLGFPSHIGLPGSENRPVIGHLSSGHALADIEVIDRKTKKPRGHTYRLRLLADNAAHLEGASGSPIVDLERRLVVGVQSSYTPDSRRADSETRLVQGTPLCRVEARRPGFAKEICGEGLGPTPTTDDGAVNPFTWRGGITDASAFFGREVERANIASRVSLGQGVQIVGPRRIGKTSLLYQLQRELGDRCRERALVVGDLDLTDARCGSLQGWLRCVARAWGWSEVPSTMGGFADRIDEAYSQGMRHVLCLDEFEAWIGASPEFDGRFFGNLRALSQGPQGAPLLFVTASKQPLSDLTKRLSDPNTSAFFNLLERVNLGPFEPRVAKAFVDLTRPGTPRFSDDEKGAILAFAQGVPLALMVACDHVLQARRVGRPLTAALEEAREAMRALIPAWPRWE